MKADNLPHLTVRLAGDSWKARVNIHVLMTAKTLADVRQFVKLYLWRIPLTEGNLSALHQIVDWFPAAIEAVKDAKKLIDRLERSKEVFLDECAKRHVPIDYLDEL